MNEHCTFCPICSKEVNHYDEFCQCGKRIKPQNPAIHIFGIVMAPVIYFIWVIFGGDYHIYEVNTVDYICAIACVTLLLMMIFINQEANKALRIISIVFLSIMSFLTIGWLFNVFI